jgi:WD40 repeat protein
MVNEFKFPAQIPSVQSLSVLGALDDSTCKALVGTRGGDVLEISLSNGKRLKNKPVVTGHNYGELWGLVVHPSNPNIFVTSGDDKSVRMWNISDQECVAMAKSDALPDMSRCLAYTQDAKFLACGCGGRLGGRKVGDMGKHAGKVVILDGTSLRHLATFKVAKEQIADICYSNDGKTLV